MEAYKAVHYVLDCGCGYGFLEASLPLLPEEAPIPTWTLTPETSSGREKPCCAMDFDVSTLLRDFMEWMPEEASDMLL